MTESDKDAVARIQERNNFCKLKSEECESAMYCPIYQTEERESVLAREIESDNLGDIFE